ncbi:MAG: hypothetical protein JNJ48_05880 [Phycisphaerae bacterium]|nr:hypothetical protein [Phycisphaerae bacterium]
MPTGAILRRAGGAAVLAVAAGWGQPAVASRQPEVEAPARQPGELDRLVSAMRSLMLSREGPTQNAVLRSLRSLRDPELAPLFATLASGQTPVQRLHGVLGLAELEGGSLDLLLVRRIERGPERSALLRAALNEGLLLPAQVEDVARWTDLEPSLLLALASRIHASGRVVPEARARELSLDAGPAGAVIGGLVLTLAGAGQEGLSVIERRGPELFVPEQREALLAVMDECRRLGVPAGRELAMDALSRITGDAMARDEAARLLLSLRPGESIGVQQVSAGLAASGDLGQRIRAALAALEAALRHADPAAHPGLRLPAHVGRTMESDAEPLIAAMGASVRALQAGDERPGLAAASLARLIETDHLPTQQRLLEVVDAAPPALRDAVLSAIVAGARAGAPAERQEITSGAAERLARVNHEALAGVVRGASPEHRAAVAAAAVVGALRAGEAGSAERCLAAAGGVRDPLCDDLGAIVRAALAVRQKRAPEGGDADRLTRIAVGEGNLVAPLRAPAAWLALRAAGRDRAALAKLLGETMPP